MVVWCPICRAGKKENFGRLKHIYCIFTLAMEKILRFIRNFVKIVGYVILGIILLLILAFIVLFLWCCYLAIFQ